MGGKSKSEAIDNFCGFFKESLSCLTDAFLHPIQKSDNQYLLTYEPPAPLLCDLPRCLSVTQLFSVAQDRQRGGFKVRTHQYSYSLLEQIEGEWREVVSYHWHPEESEVRYPHLHLACVPRVHFPTARVSIERFIRMLIDYYEIQPVLSENQWKQILHKNNDAFDRMATWK